MKKKAKPAAGIEKELVGRLREVMESEAGMPYPYAGKKSAPAIKSRKPKKRK